MFYVVCILNVVVFGFSTAEQNPLARLSICERNSTNYFNCLKFMMQKAWPEIVEGIPEFEIPPLDPVTYNLGEIVIDANAIHGKINISTLVVQGLTKIRFLTIKPHFLDDVFQLELDIKIPNPVANGYIDGIGTVVEIKVRAKGHFNVTMEDVRISMIFTGSLANDRWTVEHVNVAMSIKKMEIYFDILNSKEINDLVVELVNEYWPALLRTILPAASNVWDSWLTDLSNRIFSKISLSEIFS